MNRLGDFSIRELEAWNEKIEEIAREEGLDYYPQEFQIVSYEDMIGYEAYIGMPSHYPHWSFGKAYEKVKTLNKYNLSGLPYEMVINSDPCLAYLMKDNTLLLQILTIAHVYGHNDFFKNNRFFHEGTRADYTLEMFKNHADRIRQYISDPGIGYEKVERIINAAHALKYQVGRVVGEKRMLEEEKQKRYLENMQKKECDHPLLERKATTADPLPDLRKIPLEPEEDILYFISEYSRLDIWEKDILRIVREEALYFLPQMETKVMNEGWASYWHYNILKRLELPQGLHLEFLKRHNQVIRPHEGQINPYYLGFKLFEDIRKNHLHGKEKIFEIRTMERDASFIRRYLTLELCREMNLFEYKKQGKDYLVTQVSDEEGWKEIRDTLAGSVGMGSIPVIRVEEWMRKENTLLLEHIYDGRELDLVYAVETLKHLEDLWGGKIVLYTCQDGRRKVISCDEEKKITSANS